VAEIRISPLFIDQSDADADDKGQKSVQGQPRVVSHGSNLNPTTWKIKTFNEEEAGQQGISESQQTDVLVLHRKQVNPHLDPD